MTPYSLDAKAGKCLMIKPVLVGRRNPETPSSGIDPRNTRSRNIGQPCSRVFDNSLLGTCPEVAGRSTVGLCGFWCWPYAYFVLACWNVPEQRRQGRDQGRDSDHGEYPPADRVSPRWQSRPRPSRRAAPRPAPLGRRRRARKRTLRHAVESIQSSGAICCPRMPSLGRASPS